MLSAAMRSGAVGSRQNRQRRCRSPDECIGLSAGASPSQACEASPTAWRSWVVHSTPAGITGSDQCADAVRDATPNASSRTYCRLSGPLVRWARCRVSRLAIRRRWRHTGRPARPPEGAALARGLRARHSCGLDQCDRHRALALREARRCSCCPHLGQLDRPGRCGSRWQVALVVRTASGYERQQAASTDPAPSAARAWHGECCSCLKAVAEGSLLLLDRRGSVPRRIRWWRLLSCEQQRPRRVHKRLRSCWAGHEHSYFAWVIEVQRSVEPDD